MLGQEIEPGACVAAPKVYHEFEKPGAVLAYDAAGTDRGNELKFTKEVSAFDSDARTGLDFLAKHECSTARRGSCASSAALPCTG